jgi:hypothetical protein
MNETANKGWFQRLRKLASLVLRVCIWVAILVLAGWAGGALCFHPWLPRFVGAGLAIGFLAAAITLVLKIRNYAFSLALIAVMIVCVYGCWLLIRPQQNRAWARHQEKMPFVSIIDDDVSIRNVRYCQYKSLEDFEVVFETRNFELSQIESVWYVIQRFTSLESLAHTFICFGLNDGSERKYFAISVEVRCEKGESFSPLPGAYKQYELMYVVGDERDILGVRTNIRENDRVYMYRVNATPEQAQQLFLRIAGRINKLRDQPEFYHTLFNNCTNNIVVHANSVAPNSVNPFAPRIILPGYSGKSAFRAGLIGKEGETFAELQARSRIDQVARKFELDENFSNNIRKTLD